MKIPGIISTNAVKLLSGLANNDSSIIPMATKDAISNCAIVHTYKKEGGKDDARERAIEEFGTGIAWLFGIPAIKKIFDKTVYPLLKLDPELDVRILQNKDSLAKTKDFLAKSTNAALKGEKDIINSLDNKNAVLKKFTNAQLYKGLSAGKFFLSTALSALALTAIIDYKQKSTQKRIEQDFYKNYASKTLINNSIKNNTAFCDFNSKDKKQIPFKGLGSLIMFNPIANTMVLDGVITGRRLTKARDGERKEVAMKEAFQLFFIYALAKPIQAGFELIGSKLKTPIGLDPMVLFDKDLKTKANSAQNTIKEILKDENLYTQAQVSAKSGIGGFFSKFGAKNLQINEKTVDANALIDKLRELNPKDSLIELLDKNGAISTIKDKKGNIEALSTIKTIDEKKVLKTFKDVDALSQNISKLSKIKGFKVAAVLGNVAIAALAMGVLQPKLNIWMRKLLNNGDNRNPAIVEQERKLQMAAAGKNNETKPQ